MVRARYAAKLSVGSVEGFSASVTWVKRKSYSEERINWAGMDDQATVKEKGTGLRRSGAKRLDLTTACWFRRYGPTFDQGSAQLGWHQHGSLHTKVPSTLFVYSRPIKTRKRRSYGLISGTQQRKRAFQAKMIA